MSYGRPILIGSGGLLCALVLGLAAAPSVSHADPLAVVAAMKGRVEVVSSKGGAAQRATFGRGLERGDKLVLGPGATATVFFNDGNVIELSEKSSVTIGGRVADKKAGRELPGEVYANVSRYVTGGSRATGLVAYSATRASDTVQPLLLAPRQASIASPRPHFSWRAVDGATRYVVTVSRDGTELWTQESHGTSLDYPADAAPLAEGGEFSWQLRAFGTAGPLRSEDSFFRVLEGTESAAVRASLERIDASLGGPEHAGSQFLAGSYLFGRGLYHDAAVRFEALARISPESPAPHEALGNVYRAIGLMDLAAAEYQKALALTREP